MAQLLKYTIKLVQSTIDLDIGPQFDNLVTLQANLCSVNEEGRGRAIRVEVYFDSVDHVMSELSIASAASSQKWKEDSFFYPRSCKHCSETERTLAIKISF